MSDDLGCRFSVNSADFLLCLRKFCGQADRGRLAGQRREFKIHRKSTAQLIGKVVDVDSTPLSLQRKLDCLIQHSLNSSLLFYKPEF